jgi:hypothetical protein
MIQQEPTYDLQTDQDLSKFLLGAIRDLRLKKITVEEADGLSKLADKYTKNEVMRLLKEKLRKANNTFNLEGEINKQLLIKASTED